MKDNQQNNISIGDFINCSEVAVINFPSVEFLANIKKDQIIISLIRIEDLKKRIANAPDNKVLKLALMLAERRLKNQQSRYYRLVELYFKNNRF